METETVVNVESDVDSLIREFANAKAFLTEKVNKDVEPLREEITRVAESIQNIEAQFKELRRNALKSDERGNIRVASGKLAGFDIVDLKILEQLVTSRMAHNRGGQDLLEVVRSGRDILKKNLTPDTILAWEDASVANLRTMFPGMSSGVMSAHKQALAGWRTGLVNMSQRALDSTTAGSGDELVPTMEAASLWMDVNLETLVLPTLQQVPMPSNPFDIPTQLGDTNWYPISENVQVTTTDPSTAKVTLTAQGLKTGVPFSDELEEDAVIALVPEIRRSLVRNAAEVIDDVLLNADTTVTNGINSDGATIATSTAGKAHWLLGFDGLIHLPVVDNTSQADNNAGVATADTYNTVLSLLGKYAVARRPGEVVFYADVRTAIRSLSITEFETVDVAGARATLSSGELLNVYGKPLIMSEQIRLADTDGKVTDSGNGTDTGRILCANTTQWRVGFRRQIQLETDREPGKGQTTLYVSFRIALQERSGTRSSATHTAVSYNITN